MFSKAKSLAKHLFPSLANTGEGPSAFDEYLGDGESDDSVVTVYRETRNPTKSWQELSVKQTHEKVTPLDLDTPIYEDKVRFVCMSDTHNRTNRMKPNSIPMGDVFLHSGDFTMSGKPDQVEEFNSFLSTLPHPHKIVIAGNHELSFDPQKLALSDKGGFGLPATMGNAAAYLRQKGLDQMSDVLTNCTYIEDAEVTVAGIRIYGSPWQPEFGSWAFNLPRGRKCLDVWNKIPSGVDILLTHGPPVGHGDKARFGHRAGCVELLNTIQKRVKPKYHLFGHIHEGYGVTTDGYTTFMNASTCNLSYRPSNPPIIFDMPLPEGASKQDITEPIKSGLIVQQEEMDTDSEEEGVEFVDFEEMDCDGNASDDSDQWKDIVNEDIGQQVKDSENVNSKKQRGNSDNVESEMHSKSRESTKNFEAEKQPENTENSASGKTGDGCVEIR